MMEKVLSKHLKILKRGDIHLIDIDAITSDFKNKPSSGDLLQYELHNYCKKNMKTDQNVEYVIKLAALCYSKESVLLFSSMDRFVGCVYFVSSYLLKNEKYREALAVACSLEFKREALLLAIRTSKDIFNFLCILHNCFLSAAVELTSFSDINKNFNLKFSHELALMSLKLFLFNEIEQIATAKKVIKKSKLYLHKLKYYKAEDITKFLELLKHNLKVMFPKFSHLDFCLFFLFKIEHMQNVDYSKGVELFEEVERITQMFLILCDFSLETKDSLNSLLNFFFNCQLLNAVLPDFRLIKSCLENVEQNKGVLLFLIISNIFHYGIQYWWKLFENNWSINISTEILQPLFTGILELHKEFHKSPKLYCKYKNSCETCFGDLLTGNLQKIQYTTRQCLKNKIPQSLILVSLAREAFKLSIDCINTMKDMGCCEMQRSYAWKYTVIHHTNLVEDILRQPPTKETWIYLTDCSQELLHEIVTSGFELPYDTRRINILFQRWHQSALKQQKFNDALFVCAAFYASYPENESDIISMWLQTKSECNNEIFQEMTILEVLKVCESAIKEFNPKFNKKVINMKSALLMELTAYGTCSDETFKDSKICYSLVYRIWNQLQKMDLDLWETSFTCACLIVSNISTQDKKLPKNFIKRCDDVLSKLKNWTYENKQQCRSLVHAANLRFYLFLHNVKSIENVENVQDTNELVLGYLKKAEEEKVKFGEDVDLNLTCNVIPASSHLTLDLENEYLISLKEITDLWNSALENGLDKLPTSLEFQLWLQNVQLVAYLYELYGEYHQSLSTWSLFYRIGKLCNDSGAVLLGLSHILENYNDVEDADIFQESVDLANQLAAKNQNKETLVIYWLMVAGNQLKNKKPAKCLDNLKTTREILQSLRMTPRIHTLHSKFWCLVSQFLVFYTEFEEEFGFRRDTDLRVIVFKAFNYAVAGAKNLFSKSVTQLECTELVLAMLEVNIWAFHFHEIYSQTDFMRFFLDDLYQIVQKLFLPTRTAEILLRLAEVDLICEKTSDCEEKVTKLKSILTISYCNMSKILRTKKPVLPCSAQESSSEKLPAISPTRFLETPPSSFQVNDISPIQMHLTNGNQQKAIRHKVECKCRSCQNFLIQILTMTTYSLEAEILKAKNQMNQALAIYAEAFNVLKKLDYYLNTEKTERLQFKISTPLKSHLTCLDLPARVIKFYTARFLIKHTLFELTATDLITENVKNGVEKIGGILKNLTYEQKLLMWKFAELKLLWLVIVKGEIKPIQKATPKEYKSIGIMKTPYFGRSRAATSLKKLTNEVEEDLFPDQKIKNANSNVDAKNMVFLGLESIPKEKKFFVQPRKLRFKTNEPPTLSKTVKKVPLCRNNDFKPKKLNLDYAD